MACFHRTMPRSPHMPDITQVILDEHNWFRRAFAALDETTDPAELGVLWQQLEGRLEAHAEAEEAIFYPLLLATGDHATEETDDAIGDHDSIREASHRARDEQPGSDRWRQAVDDARVENSEHMAEEERGALADFRRNTTAERRHGLGQQFIIFLAQHTRIDVPRDYAGPDPDDYIDEHTEAD